MADRFAEFAIARDVDAKLFLVADDIVHRGAQSRAESLRVTRRILLAVAIGGNQRLGAGQAADMGG